MVEQTHPVISPASTNGQVCEFLRSIVRLANATQAQSDTNRIERNASLVGRHPYSFVSRLLEVKQQQELLANEQKELNEQLRLAHLRGDLLTLLPVGRDGNGYQITSDFVLNRRPGR